MSSCPDPVRVLAAIDHPVPAALADDPRLAITLREPFGDGSSLTAEELDTQVLLSDVVPRDVEQMTRLRWLQLGSAGYQQLAGSGLAARGVRVTNASGVNDVPIAEWCVLMMMTLLRDLPQLLRDVDQRRYRRPERYQRELRGSRLGVVGYGGIGREVARLSVAHGLLVRAMNRSPIGPAPLRYAPAGTGDPAGTLPVERYRMQDWARFLDGLDFVVLTVALNAGTEGLFGAEQFAALPPTALLLNPARAQLVDEAALRRALVDGTLAGAALDSHYREPMAPDDPTWSLPRTVVTPHISGSTGSPQYRPRLWDLFGRNLNRFVAGEPLLNLVPPGDLPD